MKSTKTLILAATMLALPIVFTSCEDILGEWSRPVPQTPQAPSKSAGTIGYAEASIQKAAHDKVKTFTNALTLTGDGAVSYESSNSAVASVDATGMVTLTGTAGTTTIKAKVADSDAYTYATNEASYTLEVLDGYTYLEWDNATKQLVSKIETNYQEIASGATTFDHTKVLVVKDADVNITEYIILTGDTKIILCDGAILTFTNGINGGATHYDLTIYGQSEQTGKLVVQDGSWTKVISSMSELNIHGGDIEATGTFDDGVSMAADVGTINVYGGKLTARGLHYGINGNNSKINVLGGMLEAYGGSNSDRVYSGIFLPGTSSSITVSNHGKLKAQGGNGSTSLGPADAGISIKGSLVAKDYAEVTVIGGSATNYVGGIGIDASGQISISNNAKLTVTGGNGVTGGGAGMKYGNSFVYENAQVKITGGNGSNGNGGDGVESTVAIGMIIIGGNVEISGGNATGTSGNGGNAAFSRVAYEGGKFSLAGGAGSTSGSDGKAMKIEGGGIKLSNISDADATFQYSTDGSAWTDFTVSGTSPGNSDDSEKVRNRYLRTK